LQYGFKYPPPDPCNAGMTNTYPLRPPPKESCGQKRRPFAQSLGYSKMFFSIILSENAEKSYKNAVVEPHLTSPKERNKRQPLLFGNTDSNHALQKC